LRGTKVGDARGGDRRHGDVQHQSQPAGASPVAGLQSGAALLQRLDRPPIAEPLASWPESRA